jgi:transcriptional regulator with PAS, ATPase and Fis domain
LLSNEEISTGELPPEILQNVNEPAMATVDRIDLESLEAQAMKEALKRHQGDKTKAAVELGISLRTLYYWIKKYNIQ